MFEIIYILILAVVLDLIFGEPKNKFHPVAWLGKIIEILFKNNFILKNEQNHKHRIFKKVYGIIISLTLIISCSFLIFLILNFFNYFDFLNFFNYFDFLNFISDYFNINYKINYFGIIFILISAVILKFTFSIKGMKEHATAVLRELKNKEINKARASASMLVGRDTKRLNESQIVSAVVESISENMVDGVMSPIFYFTIAYILTNSIAIAVSFAVGFRIASTLDSMIGYKNKKFTDLGWFSARLDDVLNYIPARLSIIFFLNLNAVKIALRDYKKAQSPNSGFPIAAIAGCLGVSLEKQSHYIIGDKKEQLKPNHIQLALKIMERSIIIFILFNIFLILLF